MQQLLITGNLGGDPEMRYTPGGKAVTNFSVADNRKFTTADGQAKEETIWFRVQAWERLAETTNEYLKKGARVLVVGELIADEHGGPKVWKAQDNTMRASCGPSRWNSSTASLARMHVRPTNRPSNSDFHHTLN